MRYVTIDKLSELTGYTAKAIRSKIERGDFIQGIHYVRAPDGRIHMDLKGYEKWVAQKPVARASKSGAAQ